METLLRSILGALLLVLSITRPYAQQCECSDQIHGDQSPAGNPLYDSESLNVVRKWLEAHNKYRCMHNVPPVVWSVSLSTGAGRWAAQCTSKHCHVPDVTPDVEQSCRCDKPIPNGWSFACGESQSFDGSFGLPKDNPNSLSPTGWPAYFADFWYNERPNYERFSNNYTLNYPMTLDQFNSDNNTANMYGHFTQLIWMNTKEIGCSACPSAVTDNGTGKAVCRYYPTGNVTSQFAANVPRPLRSSSECDPSLMNYTQAWQSANSQWALCWRYSGGSIPGDPQCDVEWTNGNVKANGSSPPVQLGGRWTTDQGVVKEWATDIGQYDICWHVLESYSNWGPPVYGCMEGATDRPPIVGIRVNGQPACWARDPNDSLGIKDVIIWCDY